MKNYKTIKIDNDSGDDKSGVSTLTIEIPVEARKEWMEVPESVFLSRAWE